MGFLPAISDLLAYPSTWSLINVRDSEFWDTVGNTDRLEELDKNNIEVNVYDGSGHAIEDPPGQGDSIFRSDALDDIVEFINGDENEPPLTAHPSRRVSVSNAGHGLDTANR